MTTIKVSLVMLLALSVPLIGCQKPASEGVASESEIEISTEAAQLPEQVQKAVQIARAIEADPAQAEQVLEEAAMTAEEFETLLYDIAADPEMRRLYNQEMAE